jgi:lipoate-protein ligase A
MGGGVALRGIPTARIVKFSANARRDRKICEDQMGEISEARNVFGETPKTAGEDARAPQKNNEHSTWLLLREGECAFDYNMAMDEALLESASGLGFPALRFYGWTEPAASFGYSQEFAEIEKLTMLRPLVRRPTGGGLVPHDADWTYSVVIPPKNPWYRIKATESYRRIHEWLGDAFGVMNVATTLSPQRQKEIPGQCFVGAEKDDLLWHGRKIAGAAQRRSRTGLLIQGSVQSPSISLSRESWEDAMCQAAAKSFGVEWKTMEIGADLRNLVENLRATKYGRKEFNEKR